MTDAGALERLFDDEAEERTALACREMADDGTDRLLHNVKLNTPVDTNPFRHRPERPRGTLRNTMAREPGVRHELRRGRDAYVGVVFSPDEIAWYVEKDTPPHEIRAKGGGFLRFQSRYGFAGKNGAWHPPGTWVSVRVVHHPGTKGAHMFTLGAIRTEAEIEEWAHAALRSWARDVGNRGRV